MPRDLSTIGCAGVISVRTRGDEGAGEVVLSVRGGTEAYLAWSAEPLEKGTRVVVVDTRAARAVDVVRAEDLGLSFGLP